MQLTTLIIAPAGRLGDSLSVLLKSHSQITLLGRITDPDAGLRLITEHQPDAVIMDADLPNSAVWPLLADIKTVAPHTRHLVLTHSSKQTRQAQIVGANTVSSAEFSAENLF
jgi:DNA-binding NarL/FixJ family response regulator